MRQPTGILMDRCEGTVDNVSTGFEDDHLMCRCVWSHSELCWKSNKPSTTSHPPLAIRTS